MWLNSKFIRLRRIGTPFVLFALGYVFSWSLALWIHEGGHILGALLTGSQIERINLIPPWEGQVSATYYSLFAQNIFFLGGFVVTFIPFLCLFLFSLKMKSRLVYSILFPLFMTFPSSWGDLKIIGFDITSFGAFIIGWFVPFIVFAAIMAYYNILVSKTK
jgi:hypothetical protein